jgi:hypothetical protein
MPSSATSFIIGMVTATAIAGGFAGVFMEDTARQQSTNVAMREPPKDATAAAAAAPAAPAATAPAATPSPVPSRLPSAPTTSGLAPPAVEVPVTQHVTARSPAAMLPSPAAAPVGQLTEGSTDRPRQGRVGEHVKKKDPHKSLAKRNKRKLEWYEDERVVAGREGYGSGNRGPFGIFP